MEQDLVEEFGAFSELEFDARPERGRPENAGAEREERRKVEPGSRAEPVRIAKHRCPPVYCSICGRAQVRIMTIEERAELLYGLEPVRRAKLPI
jgi:hypothetical protein